LRPRTSQVAPLNSAPGLSRWLSHAWKAPWVNARQFRGPTRHSIGGSAVRALVQAATTLTQRGNDRYIGRLDTKTGNDAQSTTWAMNNGKGYLMKEETPSLAELDERIAIVRDNIRELVEQAAAFSGAQDEERNADRIAQQQAELERLLRQRDQLIEK
jgi:hypothetical protein